MADAHAEIGVIQQAYAAGKTMGASMELTVSGKAVCGYCRGDIAAMAEKSGLTSLTVKEVATGKTLYWQPGMRALREGLDDEAFSIMGRWVRSGVPRREN